MSRGSDFSPRFRIRTEDVDRFRERVEIGDIFRLEEEDTVWHSKITMKEYRVTEIYKHLCVLKCGKRKITRTWVDLILG